MAERYILNECGDPVPCNDLEEWAKAFENDDARRVALTHIGDAKVSTVFLGLNHSFGGEAPILWETMVFGGKHDQYQVRCGGGRDNAQAMHDRVCKEVAQ